MTTLESLFGARKDPGRFLLARDSLNLGSRRPLKVGGELPIRIIVPRLLSEMDGRARPRISPSYQLLGRLSRLYRLFVVSLIPIDRYDRFELPPANPAGRYFEHHPYDPDPLGYVFDECSTRYVVRRRRPSPFHYRRLLGAFLVDPHQRMHD